MFAINQPELNKSQDWNGYPCTNSCALFWSTHIIIMYEKDKIYELKLTSSQKGALIDLHQHLIISQPME
jgi:hypothetical protein